MADHSNLHVNVINWYTNVMELTAENIPLNSKFLDQRQTK
jgi:hypothetical protein